jgi:hypothetical protein
MKMHVDRAISAALGAAVIFGLHLRRRYRRIVQDLGTPS